MARRALAWIVWPILVPIGMASVRAATERGVPVVGALVALQLAMVVVVTALERFTPEHASWNVDHRDLRTDALHLLVSGVLVSGALRGVIFGLIPSLGVWPTRLPTWAQLLLALALVCLLARRPRARPR